MNASEPTRPSQHSGVHPDPWQKHAGVTIIDLGPISDDSGMHLVRLDDRHFRMHSSLLKAIQRGPITDLNPRVHRELQRFEQALTSPMKTVDVATHLKLRTEFNVEVILGFFQGITESLARHTTLKVSSAVTVAVLTLTACAMTNRDIHASGLMLFGSILLLMMASFMHEIGHISVARHVGAPASRMGVGLYWGLLPAFYADVTSSWLLTKQHRIAVTLAGPLYTIISMIPLGIGALVISGPLGDSCLVALRISAVAFLFNFLPFGRLDGYWLLVDVTGERHLSKNSTDFLAQVLSGRIPPQASNFIRVYSVLRFAMIVFFFFLLCRALYHFYQQAPTLVSGKLELPTGFCAIVAVYAAFVAIWLIQKIRKAASLSPQ